MYWITEKQMEKLKNTIVKMQPTDERVELEQVLSEVNDQTCYQLDYFTYQLKMKSGRNVQ